MPAKDMAAYRRSPKGLASKARERLKAEAKREAMQPEDPFSAQSIQPLLSTWGKP
jgi:hypothetical protein